MKKRKNKNLPFKLIVITTRGKIKNRNRKGFNMNRYNLKLSINVPNAGGYRNSLRIGLPIEADMVNDICICAEGSYEFVPLNHNVLRQALLANPEITKQLLGIEVKDATIVNVVEQPKQKPTKKEGAKK